jgi:hypothetical protein
LLPFGSIRLGEIEIERIDRYTWAGRLVFTVPKIEPGSYVVTHCNDPCTKELGDLLHPRIRIVENDTETRLWRRIDALRDAVQARRYEIMRANVKFDELSERERIRLEALGNQLGQLRRASVARDPVEERSEFPWLLAGSAFAIGGAGGLMASVRRGRS